MGNDPSQSSSPPQNPAILSKTKTKGSAQSSCSILSTILWRPRPQLRGYPGSLACSQLLSSFRLLPGGCLWSWAAIGHAASRTAKSCAPGLESTQTHWWTLHQFSKRDRDSLLEAMGHVTSTVHGTWKGQARAPSKYRSRGTKMAA